MTKYKIIGGLLLWQNREEPIYKIIMTEGVIKEK